MSALEKRIASALSSDDTAGNLAALVDETEAAIIQADATAEAEREKALDPLISRDAAKARAIMEDAAFTRDRLRTVLPRLQQKHQEVAAQEYRAQWREDYEAHKVERDALATELRELYPNFASKITDLFTRMAANDTELSRLHQARPSGVSLHLLGAELVARGLESFSIARPSIVEQLQLPNFDHSGQTLWPRLVPLNPVLIAPVVAGDPRQHSADWWKVKEEEARAVTERQEREAADEEAKARANWRGPRWWEGERA